jgi:hypothetical protein
MAMSDNQAAWMSLEDWPGESNITDSDALISMAVSLKRIADALTGTPKTLGVVDYFFEAVRRERMGQ